MLYQILSTGFAMFAMFFGAGNIIYPLLLGHQSLTDPWPAIFGLLFTAVVIPLSGLVAIILFDGDYNKFFAKIGKIPGLLFSFLIITLLGPLGATPRCIATSYATLKTSFPAIDSELFSLVACFLIFVFAFKKTRMLNLVGSILTPLLLSFLAILIIKGLYFAPMPIPTSSSADSQFVKGFVEGYKMMDLLAAFFFAPVIINSFNTQKLAKNKFILAFYSSLIGGALLALTYAGFCYISYYYKSTLPITQPDQIIGAISSIIMGPYAGLITSAIVSLACLTTAIALISAFTEFLEKTILKEKISYSYCLLFSVVTTYFVAILEFSTISSFLGPILEICYPGLILLTFINIIYKLRNPTVAISVPIK